jgi:hypothetical protein
MSLRVSWRRRTARRRRALHVRAAGDRVRAAAYGQRYGAGVDAPIADHATICPSATVSSLPSS